MWFSAFWMVFLSAGVTMAQSGASIRHITIEALPSSPTKGFAPIEFATIAAAWERSRVNLELEKPLDRASIARAKAVVGQLYARQGHVVRVEHAVSDIEPRAVKVAFRVVEVCIH